MNPQVAKELLNELSAALEALETQSSALLQLLKQKGIVKDEELAPHLEQAGNASNVRWLAAKVRLERIFEAAEKEEEKKAAQKVTETGPKEESKGPEPETKGQRDEADKTAEAKPDSQAQKATDKTDQPAAQPDKDAA